MTDESKRMSFSQMCAALPEDFSWGDSLTPDVFQHIEVAILQAATRDTLASYISEEGVLFGACMVRHIDPNGTPKEVLDRLINWEVQINAEFATSTATDADVADAQRYRWLQKQRSHVWMEFADVPMNSTDALIDAAIAASAPKCVCGEPDNRLSIHRIDGPCYRIYAPKGDGND